MAPTVGATRWVALIRNNVLVIIPLPHTITGGIGAGVDALGRNGFELTNDGSDGVGRWTRGLSLLVGDPPGRPYATVNNDYCMEMVGHDNIYIQ